MDNEGQQEGTISGTTGTTKKRKRRKRVRSPHPGVKLKRRKLPSGGTSWRAHYVDVDTGREVAVTLDPLELPSREARESWAKTLAAELARKKMERAAGVRAAEVTALDVAIEDYLASAKARLRARTVETQELAIKRLTTWAHREGVKSTADLTRARLASLREYLIRQPKRSAKAGSGRGASRATDRSRSPYSVNRELASIKAICNVWRTQGRLPNVHRDDLADALAALPLPHEDPTFYRPPELRRMIASALLHDEATFDETREEHAGDRPKGTTPRYVAIAPFFAVLLLSGMRRGEALALTWSMVDLEAVDHDGRAAGEIRLPASIVKTKRARTIGLEVSPAIRKILAALRLQRGERAQVFDGFTGDLVDGARRRMIDDFGSPPFTWQGLRSTAATYLTNAPGIFGAASVFMSARMLGHAVAVAEKHYLGVHRGIPREARTVEAAMQIEPALAKVLGALVLRQPARQRGAR